MKEFSACALRVDMSKGSNKLSGCFCPFHMKTEAKSASETLHFDKNHVEALREKKFFSKRGLASTVASLL